MTGIWKKFLLKRIIRIRGKDNLLEITGKLKNSKIKINGNNNTLIIEEGRYKNIDIGIDGDNHTIIIKSSNRITGLKIVVQNHDNKVSIDTGVGIAGALLVACGTNNSISIGQDSMISDDVAMWGCDGHSITQAGKVINLSKPIVIGSHVWIGTGVKILKGTTVGDNSVVGMGSLLNGKEYPNNKVIVGNPAKVVKENIDWTIENLEI